MLKIIWISDPHFAREGTIQGHDPRIRLQAAIQHINQHHHDADLCVISGDLVNRGTRNDYDALHDHLSTLAVPLFPLVGNHDNRSLFRSTFTLPNGCMTEYVQYAVPDNTRLILCLDTQKIDSDAGEFCAKRYAWLQHKLETAINRSVYIFMHHPPMPLGLPMQDTENMQMGEAFLELISRYDNVKYLFIGHVHRPITGTVQGIPFSTMRSLLYQAPAPRPEWTWDTFKPSEEAPNIGVITINQSGVNLQYEQFCHYEAGGAKR